MEFEFFVDNALHRISLEKKEDGFEITDGETRLTADIQTVSANGLSVVVAGRASLVYIARDQDKTYVSIAGQQFILQEPGREGKGFHGADEKTQQGALIVTAPMPGKVIKIAVAEQEAVRKNQTLAIVEAMKMENEIKSSLDGFVKSIFVSEGELVDSEKPLIELEAKKETGAPAASGSGRP